MLFASKSTAVRHNSRPAKSNPVVVLTDKVIKDLFRRAHIVLKDGAVPVLGRHERWTRHQPTGLLNAVIVNDLTGARYLYGPDLARGGSALRCITRIA